MKSRKNYLLPVLIAFAVALASCKKNRVPANGNEILGQTEVIYSGKLIGGEAGDEARGDVTVEKAANKYYLVFKDFTSHSGPDLHVYFSRTAGNRANPPFDYYDLGFLKYTSGTFFYELPAAPDVVNYKYVLIWCVRYRIRFGYTELK